MAIIPGADWGKGSVFKLQSGKRAGMWKAELTIGYNSQTGKRARRSVTRRTKREAENALKAMREELERNSAGRSAGDITVEQYFEEWLQEVEASLRPLTYSAYAHRLRAHVYPEIGRMKLVDLAPVHLQRLINQLSKTLAPNTVRSTAKPLSSGLQRAVDWEWLDKNPMRAVRLPSETQTPIEPYTPDQIQTLLDSLLSMRGYSGTVAYYALVTSMFLGLRIGEVTGLCWDSIDLANERLTIKRQLTRRSMSSRELVLTPPKTKAGQRQLPLPSTLGAELLSWRDIQDEWRAKTFEAAKPWLNDENLVFTRPNGERVQPNTLHAALRKAQERNGLPIVRWQGLGRKSYTTHLLREGVNLKAVSELLGHADTSITTQVYLQVMADDKRIAAEAIDGVLGPVFDRRRGHQQPH